MRGKRRTVSIDQLKIQVLEECLSGLVEACRREGTVAPDNFRQELLRMKEERDLARARAQPRIEADRAIRDLALVAERGRLALAAMGAKVRCPPIPGDPAEEPAAKFGGNLDAPHGRLRAVLESLYALDDFDRFAHRSPLHVEAEGANREDLHRKAIIAEYAGGRFLGLHRSPTIRELAMLRLLFDPDHGCSPRRADNVERIRTAYAVIKAEMDAIRRHVKKDNLARQHIFEE